MKFRNSLYALAIAGACSVASAQIVSMNIGSYTSGSYDLSQVNANISLGVNQNAIFNDFAYTGSGATLQVYNSSSSPDFIGLDGDGLLKFSVISFSPANPQNLSAGQTIDGSLTYSSSDSQTVFKNGSTISPNFGPNSYMGFRIGSSGSYNYGWLEVTWDSTLGNFQVLNGAYENTVNTAILAGATASPVPEASGSVAGLGLAVAGLYQLGRRRRNTVTQ